MLGTFYLPNSTLLVDTDAPVAASSAFTAIIAHSVAMLKHPNLVLNSNYNQTSVPVPRGLSGGKVSLEK